MNLVILGPQGAGKGTQSARLSDKYDIPTVATGEIFRWAISGATSLGNKAREYVDEGRLVPDEITIGVVQERLSADDTQDGFLLDGFPRNIHQAEVFDVWLEEHGKKLDAVLMLEVPDDVALRRLLGRRVCINCGRNYHVDAPPENNWTCDECGGKVESRFDDQKEEIIRGRLRLFHEQTEPLKEYYSKRGLLRVIDGTTTPDEVFEKIVTAI